MKIQLKRSNVLDGGLAKAPTAEQMEYGELALNYSATDPSIFIKNSSNAVIKLIGEGAVTTFWDTSGNFLFPVNLSSSVLLGASAPETPTIRLNVDGSATFADTVNCRELVANTQNDSEGIYIKKQDGTFPVILKQDGSITAASGETTIGADGTITIGDNPNGSENIGVSLATTGGLITRTTLNPSVKIFPPTGTTPSIALNRDGTAEFGGQVIVSGDPSNGANNGLLLTSGGFGIVATGNSASNILTGHTQGSSTPTTTIGTDGSATFAGSVISGGNANNGAETGVRLLFTGLVQASSPNDNSYVWTGYKTGSATTTSSILADGSATFAGNVLIGGTPPTAPNISLDADGTAEFKSSVDGRIDITGANTAANAYLRLNPGSTAGSYITNNGGQASVLFLGSGAINAQQTCVTSTGSFMVGGTLPSAPSIELKSNGTIEMGTYVNRGRLNTYGPTSGAASNTAFGCAIADDASGLNQKQTVQINQDGSATFAGTVTASGLTANGLLQENYVSSSGKFTDGTNANLDLSTGMIFTSTAADTSAITLNFVYTGSSVNTVLSDGNTFAATVIVLAGSGGYVSAVQIDGVAQSIQWVGGAAPDASGDAGRDIYSIQVLKAGSSSYTIIANVVNAA